MGEKRASTRRETNGNKDGYDWKVEGCGEGAIVTREVRHFSRSRSAWLLRQPGVPRFASCRGTSGWPRGPTRSHGQRMKDSLDSIRPSGT